MKEIKNKFVLIIICIIYIFLFIPSEIKYLLRWLRSVILKKNFKPIIQEVPWVTYKSKIWLDSYLKPDMSLFEFGSGGSTLYFSKKVKEVVSIEHDKRYYNIFSKIIKQKKISNCDLQLFEVNELNESNNNINNPSVKKYAMSINKFPNGYFDLIFIDGEPSRNNCIKNAVKKIKHGGYLMLDNSNNKKFQVGINMLNKYPKVDFIGLGPICPIYWNTTIWKIK